MQDNTLQIAILTYERDRARMLNESASAMADYRMRKILELGQEIKRLRAERNPLLEYCDMIDNGEI